MKDNSFAYVILALIILVGSIIVAFLVPEKKEEYNIISTINGTKYEAIIYTNNVVAVGFHRCIGNNCFNETKEYKYSKEVMNELRNMIKSFDNDFVEYDKDEIYNILIYDTNTDKALYDPDSYELINLTNRLILGQK